MIGTKEDKSAIIPRIVFCRVVSRGLNHFASCAHLYMQKSSTVRQRPVGRHSPVTRQFRVYMVTRIMRFCQIIKTPHERAASFPHQKYLRLYRSLHIIISRVNDSLIDNFDTSRFSISLNITKKQHGQIICLKWKQKEKIF